jgi:hypothetical protein
MRTNQKLSKPSSSSGRALGLVPIFILLPSVSFEPRRCCVCNEPVADDDMLVNGRAGTFLHRRADCSLKFLSSPDGVDVLERGQILLGGPVAATRVVN